MRNSADLFLFLDISSGRIYLFKHLRQWLYAIVSILRLSLTCAVPIRKTPNAHLHIIVAMHALQYNRVPPV
jgi:hypothetical protein